jgi:hypothetical protein
MNNELKREIKTVAVFYMYAVSFTMMFAWALNSTHH